MDCVNVSILTSALYSSFANYYHGTNQTLDLFISTVCDPAVTAVKILIENKLMHSKTQKLCFQN